jgi:glycosyltransferase involved in cell wall biosynthesis
VCTRNRPDLVAQAVASLLDASDSALELIVVDQSDGDETERALVPFRSDERLRYVRSARRGKGAALNEGLSLARGDVVALTDDDCRVPAGWAADMGRIVEAHPSVGVVFCRVVPVPHDIAAGYVPAFEPSRDRLLRSVLSARNGLGLGAAMAVRREVALSLGGFDESFGPGGRFPSADEWDLSLRALLKGWHVYETTELAVLHDGFRSFADGREHARRDWIAIGAFCAKPLRAGYLRAAIVPAWIFSSRALLPLLKDLAHLRRPNGVGRVTAFLRGFVEGLATAVDPVTLRYVARDGAAQKRASPNA